MLGSKPRICPECSLLLHTYKEEYWCHHCWLVFKIEDTKEHPGGLCKFVVQEVEGGKVLLCLTCTKSLYFTNEEISIMEEKDKVVFDQIPNNRKELEEWRNGFRGRQALLEQFEKMSEAEVQELVASTRLHRS